MILVYTKHIFVSFHNILLIVSNNFLENIYSSFEN